VKLGRAKGPSLAAPVSVAGAREHEKSEPEERCVAQGHESSVRTSLLAAK